MARPPPPPATSASDRDVLRYLNRVEWELERLDHRVLLAQWDLALGRPSGRPEPWENARYQLVGRREVLDFADRALRRRWPPLVARRLELLRRVSEDALVEHRPSIVLLRNHLMRRLGSHRPKVRGRRRTLAEIWEGLNRNPDRAWREEAWGALHAIPPGDDEKFLELVHERNAAAQGVGYPTLAHLRTAQEGLALPWLERTLDRLVRTAGRVPFQRLREVYQERSGESRWAPWDLYRAYRVALPDLDRFFPPGRAMQDVWRGLKGWGFRPSDHPIRVVRRPIVFGGLCNAVRIPKDVRVVVNPIRGLGNCRVLLHEMGHALDFSSVRASSHLLRGPETIAGFGGRDEGFGGLFGDVGGEVGWLSGVPGISMAKAREFHDIEEWLRATAPLNMSVEVRKEIALYRNPGRGVAALFRRMEREAMGFDEMPIEPLMEPILVQLAFYRKSYFLAALFAEQVRRAALAEVGGGSWPNLRMASWLRTRWFRWGDTYDWVPQVRATTGRPFAPEAYLDRLRGAVRG